MAYTISGTDGLPAGGVAQEDLAANVVGVGPLFSAYATAAQSLPHATWTKVNFPTEEFDLNSNFASSRFTATVAGYYMFTAGVEMVTSTYFGVSFWKNGAIKKVGILGSGIQLAQGAAIIHLAATDYVEVYAYQAFGSAQNTIGGADVTYFAGVLVRAA